MKKTNTAATVFNHWKDPVSGAVTYRPTILRDVRWEAASISNLSITGVSAGDAVSLLTLVIIWFDVNAEKRQYIKPKAYARLPAGEVDGYWTLQDDKDRMVKGALVGVGPVGKIQDITSFYDDAIKVQSAQTCNYGPKSMRHWEFAGSGA